MRKTTPRRMARGGRTRPVLRGRKMPGGGSTCGGMNQPPCTGGGYRRGGRPAPRGRAMARGGRTRPVPKRMPRGGAARGRGRRPHSHGHTHPHRGHGSIPGGNGNGGNGNNWCETGVFCNPNGNPAQCLAAGDGAFCQNNPDIPNVGNQGGCCVVLRRGGKLRRGGRPVRRMPHGGQTHGQAFCPAGTYRTADGLCTPMGS